MMCNLINQLRRYYYLVFDSVAKLMKPGKLEINIEQSEREIKLQKLRGICESSRRDVHDEAYVDAVNRGLPRLEYGFDR